jgi:hypothetical protein
MAIILLITLSVLVLAAVVATVIQIQRDGYHPVPTRPGSTRRP